MEAFRCIPQRKGAEAKQQPEVDEFIAVITTRVAYLSYSFSPIFFSLFLSFSLSLFLSFCLSLSLSLLSDWVEAFSRDTITVINPQLEHNNNNNNHNRNGNGNNSKRNSKPKCFRAEWSRALIYALRPGSPGMNSTKLESNISKRKWLIISN